MLQKIKIVQNNIFSKIDFFFNVQVCFKKYEFQTNRPKVFQNRNF
jgi:hypothetical protein